MLSGMMVTGFGAILIEKAMYFDCAGLLLSVTLVPKAKVPAAVGVPEMFPLELRLRPVGRAPEVICHE